tara:strand:- start:363 stop:758 length:396 start_codon:yes stop_codon:yes gene_type:complete
MTIVKHGLNLGIERIDSQFYLTLKAIGTLTHEDYQVITPLVDSALAEVQQPKISALVDITELQGWEMQAAWEDFKFGLKHGNEFEKIALVGNKSWQEWAAKIGTWFIAGEIKFFEQSDIAISWIHESEQVA